MSIVDTRLSKAENLVKGAEDDWEIVIGMEVHAQISSKTKLFSAASTEFGRPPNSNVSLVDAAMPGMLPVINLECVRQAVRTGLGLRAKINRVSVFDRKNYFYPDLPQGYQISQYKQPIVGEGEILLDLSGGETIRVGIERLHLEQDAGKSLHDQHPRYSYVDLNRSGIALMEIVSKPDMRSAAEARAFLTKLRMILRYLGTCDGNMEEGSMRADVNVSVRRPGEAFGTRCEIKNVNSIKFVGNAIEFEARRQIDLLEDGGIVAQQTRLFDPASGQTRAMRSKEEAHDYRYFPDPDLPPLELDADMMEELGEDLPELPDDKKARFIAQYYLSDYDASLLVAEREAGEYFEILAQDRSPKLAANWLANELFGRLNKAGLEIGQSPVSPAQLGAIIDLIEERTISGKIGKELFETIWEEGGDPHQIVREKNLTQLTDSGAIEAIVEALLEANPAEAARAREKPGLIGWFVGQVMKETQGKADPKRVNELLRQKIGTE